MESTLRWIVLIPLIGAALNGFTVRLMPRKLAGIIACSAVGISFLLSVRLFIAMVGMDAADRSLHDLVYT